MSIVSGQYYPPDSHEWDSLPFQECGGRYAPHLFELEPWRYGYAGSKDIYKPVEPTAYLPRDPPVDRSLSINESSDGSEESWNDGSEPADEWGEKVWQGSVHGRNAGAELVYANFAFVGTYNRWDVLCGRSLRTYRGTNIPRLTLFLWPTTDEGAVIRHSPFMTEVDGTQIWSDRHEITDWWLVKFNREILLRVPAFADGTLNQEDLEKSKQFSQHFWQGVDAYMREGALYSKEEEVINHQRYANIPEASWTALTAWMGGGRGGKEPVSY